jgi:asparagine synthase (glutamine-hydrolysing)
MCGIAGAFSLSGPLDPAIRAALPAMTDAIRHRGPDGAGFYDDGIAALGHRRLAIIDVAGGHQPLANEDEQVWIVFNGEIYNHHALRAELQQQGHRFRTHSDTETIVHAYEQFGSSCLDRIDGMFAFAIYDKRNRELFITRDRLGKKPLFYGTFGGAVHFGSEIKALRRSPAFDNTLSGSWLEMYLALGYILAPKTVYQHVHKLEPGHWLKVSPRGVEVRQYWDVTEFDTDLRSEAAILEELDRVLGEAVRARLESEVPLGAFLSGGIDSGLVVSYMAEQKGSRPTTVSVGFADKGHNELDAAAETAKALGTSHHAHLLTTEIATILNTIVDAFDEPFADPSCIPTYFVSKVAREHVTVALSGDGGDEPFAGYDFRYGPHAVEAAARRFVPPFTQPAVAGLAAVWPRSAQLPKVFRVGTLLDNLGRTGSQAYYSDLAFIKPGLAASLVRSGKDAFETETAAIVADVYNRCTSPDAVQRAEYADLKLYLPNGPVTKVDRMSMAHGLEVRCPLLDRSVVEFAFRIPVSAKMRNLRGKHLLRALAARRLPSRIATLPKHGFSAPVGDWVIGTLRDRFEANVLSARSRCAGLLDTTAARRFVTDQETGRSDRSHALWALWVLGEWLTSESVGAPAV